ncbi:hypothetical protein HDR58_09705 [bacterium]|nr:hypothetical protein [bacterium]
MLKLLTIGLLLGYFTLFIGQVHAYTVTQVKNVPNYSNYSSYNDNAAYNADLSRVERFLFNKTYAKESNTVRLARIEKELFSRSYPTMSISQRMNNVLANYRTDYRTNNYYNAHSNNYYRQNNVRNRMLNSLIGQPTGYTPAITNSSYLNGFGPSINRGYYGTNGWGYHNSYRPTYSGAGIHILD